MHPFLTNYTRRYVSSAIGDPYFNNVTLLLHCDGTDGSTTFTDVKGHTITPSGNAQIDTTQSKFGGASALFDGTGDYLSVTDSVDWALGSGDWTIECWVRLAATETAQELITQRQDSVNLTDFWLFRVESDNTIRFYDKSSNSVVTDVRSTSTLSSGQWYHVAAVRASGSVSLYVGGVKSANVTTNLTSAYSDKVHPLYVATGSAGTSLLQGHLDDIRITKGIARYTTDFTPPTLAFPDVPQFSPDPFFSNVVLLAHMDGTDGSTIFTDVKGNTLTPSGNAQIVTGQSKFGGASAYFDANGDGVRLPNVSALNLSSVNFTIEGWFRTATNSSLRTIFDCSDNDSRGIRIYQNSTNVVFAAGDSTAGWNVSITATGIIAVNTWVHFAFVRSGDVHYAFLDGVQIGTPVTAAYTLFNSTYKWVGCKGTTTPVGEYYSGYLDDIRVTKGIARYTTNFTPPTVAFPDS
jgi:hypothetical protein